MADRERHGAAQPRRWLPRGPPNRHLGCRAVDNGQIGVTAIGRGVLIEGTEIARNNSAGYEPGWEAGGSKFAYTTDLVVRGNNVHHNDGPGLWTDIDNIRTVYEDNEVNDNKGEGIFHEISYSAVIRNNHVRRNGLTFNAWLWGAGIHVASSRDVEVYGNYVEGNGNGIAGTQQARGDGAYGPRILSNLVVHHNTVRTSGSVGVGQDVGDPSAFSSRGIRFMTNNYRTTQQFSWNDTDYRDATTWRSYGHDLDATWVSDGEPGASGSRLAASVGGAAPTHPAAVRPL